MIAAIRQRLREDGGGVSISQLCRWFDVPRRTFYYRTTRSAPRLRPELVEPVRQLIEEEPSFGYRTVAGLHDMNNNTVQRIFQLNGWQVRKRAIGHRPRIEALPSVAEFPNARWATDLFRVWGGRSRAVARRAPSNRR
jgi:putative transposase